MNKKIKSFLFKNKKRTAISIVVFLLLCFVLFRIFSAGKKTPNYATVQVTRGTFISSVSESGQVAITNRLNITSDASGIINHVYAQNGSKVTAGQPIANALLDQVGLQRQEQAWQNYLTAKTALAKDQASLYTLQSDMFTAWQTYTNLATDSTYQNPDGTANTENRTLPQFTTVQDDWLASESNYKNQQNIIASDEISVETDWLAYEATSSTITAPTAGIITDLTITPGMQIGNSNSSSSNNSSSLPTPENIATVISSGKPAISIDLSEVDVAKVKIGDEATVTLDAFPNQTFTGKITGINTTGEIASGVTQYPATILLDQNNNNILPNMSATANIITGVENNVLLVPSSAVQILGGQSIVQILKNGNISSIPVQTGPSSDTQTVIKKGLVQGETIIINAQTNNTSSPFSSNLFGGGAVHARAGRTVFFQGK